MKKKTKYFLLFLAGIMVLCLLVSVGTIKLPTVGGDDEAPEAPQVTYFPIYTDLENVTLTSYQALKVSDNGDTVCLTFTPNDGYHLPEDITVTGCDYMWDEVNGWLFLANASNNVLVSISGASGSGSIDPSEPIYYTITVNAVGTSASASNPTSIADQAEYVTLKFSALNGYTLPDEVEVDGAKSLWNPSTGTLTISSPTDDVYISIVSQVQGYYVRTDLNGVVPKSTNTDYIPGSLLNSNITLYYTAAEGYELPEKITVYNAKYQWIRSTGTLIIYDIKGDVGIFIDGVKLPTQIYTINAGHWYALGESDQETTNAIWKSKLIDEGVKLPIKINVEAGGVSSYEAVSDYSITDIEFLTDGTIRFWFGDGSHIDAYYDENDTVDVYLEIEFGFNVTAEEYHAFTTLFEFND